MRFLRYLLSLFLPKIRPETQSKEEVFIKKDYTCQISFCLNADKEIDIYCKLPDIKNSNMKSIHNDSMIVAEFLHIVHSGRLQQQTLSLIKEETEYNPEEKLFFDNIVFYLTLLDTEKNKSSKASTSEPLVKPSRAFTK